MHKRMTLTLDEDVYDGLYRMVGRRKISQFIEDLVRPHLDDTALEAGYKAMAADEAHEAEAQEWINAVVGDIPDEPW